MAQYAIGGIGQALFPLVVRQDQRADRLGGGAWRLAAACGKRTQTDKRQKMTAMHVRFLD